MRVGIIKVNTKIIVIDTSVLCCYLNIPGKETCGYGDSKWDHKKVLKYINDETKKNATLVLPLATIIETGNHVAQAKERRYECAQELATIMIKTANKETPWAAFTEQSDLWNAEKLKSLALTWPSLAATKISLGDATIKDVADYYSKIDKWKVEIFTGDKGLKSYEPIIPVQTPRRRHK